MLIKMKGLVLLIVKNIYKMIELIVISFKLNINAYLQIHLLSFNCI